MLWRIAYAQLYFTDLYCPEFTVDELKNPLNDMIKAWKLKISENNLTYKKLKKSDFITKIRFLFV